MINFSSIPAFSVEEALAAAARRFEAAIAAVAPPERFIGTSLGAWIEHASAAGIAHVPCWLLGAVSRAEWQRWIEHGEFDEGDGMARVRQAAAGMPAPSMVRWDPCASLELKLSIAEQLPVDQTCRVGLPAGDPRACDILMEYPSERVPVWGRPWVQAQIVDGFPVEFRVFIREGQIDGIASYYPQRPLPHDARVLSWVSACRASTNQLINHLNEAGEFPWMLSYEGVMPTGSVSATLDFIVDQAGQVLLLEAGPPYGCGAHPCAFIDRPIAGVALALAEGVTLR
jgi:hypothetical protein